MIRKNFRQIFFAIFSVMVVLTGFSSSPNFNPGYVLLTKTDTLFGEIANNSYHQNSLFVDFRERKSGSISRFSPEQVYGYRFEKGKYYVSRKIQVSDEERFVFVEYLIHGRLKLFFFCDQRGINHYFASNDSINLIPLISKEDIVKEDGQLFLRRNRAFVLTLGKLTGDAPEVHRQLENISKLSHRSLIRFAENYHSLVCDDNEPCIIFSKSMPSAFSILLNSGPILFFGHGGTQTISPNFGIQFLLRQTSISESFFIGLGFSWISSINYAIVEKKRSYFIPLSLSYLNPRLGITPTFSYELDLSTFLGVQWAKAGLNYRTRKLAFNLSGGLMHSLFVLPDYPKIHGLSLNAGILYDLF